MSKIKFYIGLNVQDVKFQCGGGAAGFEPGIVRYGINSTHRSLIEQGLHPRKIAEHVLREIKYCEGEWDLHISTHSDIPLNVVGHMIHDNLINPADVEVYILSDDNQTIQMKSGYDKEGFLVNWPYGFMEFDFNEAKRLVGIHEAVVVPE